MIEQGRDFDELCRHLEPVIESWVDTVVPRDVELVRNNLYAPSYAWMYAYEKSLRSRIERALGRRLRELERVLFGADGVISEGLSNAFVHGHGRLMHLPITVECRVYRSGIALAIRDRGSGFDVDGVVAGLTRGSGYFSYAGNGLKALDRHDRVVASWRDDGRALFLSVLVDDDVGRRVDQRSGRGDHG